MSDKKDKTKSKSKGKIPLDNNSDSGTNIIIPNTSENPQYTLYQSNTQLDTAPHTDDLSVEAVLPYSEVHICTSKKIKDLQNKKNYSDVKKVEKISRRRHKDAKDKFLMDNPDNLTIFILPSEELSITTLNFADETSNKKKRGFY